MMKNNRQEINHKRKAAIYINYEETDYDELKKKEEILIKYCEENNYDIVKKYFDCEISSYPYFSNAMRTMLKEQGIREYDYLIACDTNDLAESLYQLVAIYAVLTDEDTNIVTINQGILGKDMLLDATYFENVMGKKELEKPRIRYDDNGNVIDEKDSLF